MEYWERRQELADRCACEGALCTARRSPAIPYRRTAFFGQKLPIPPSIVGSISRVDKAIPSAGVSFEACRLGVSWSQAP